MALTGEIRLSIDSRLEEVRLLSAVVETLCGAVGLGPDTGGTVVIAVVEALNNAVIHAYGRREGHPVTLTVSLEPERLVFAVEDGGESLGQLRQPSLEFDPDDLSTLPTGGMGLFIIHQTMDEVSYRSDLGLNTLTMVKRLPPKAAEPV